jgi:hypothetical protein
MNVEFGKAIKQAQLDGLFLSGPGEDLIPKTLMQMAKVPGFIVLFGSYVPESDQQRWADYNRFDWNIRQLPTINVFEAAEENKDSDQAFLRGTVNFQVYWPPNARRGDSRRIEAAFKGVVENFFSSDYTKTMLDEIYFIERPEKVYGLNEYGKTLTWSPNTEGIIADELVPVTIVNVQYRIDLRAWYRALEYMYRTKGEPFKATLDDLKIIGGINSVYAGEDPNNAIHPIQVEIPDEILVNQ